MAHGCKTRVTLLIMSKPCIAICRSCLMVKRGPSSGLPAIFWSSWAMSGCWCRPVGSAGITVWRRRSRTIAPLMSNNGVHFWRPMKTARRGVLPVLLFRKYFRHIRYARQSEGPVSGAHSSRLHRCDLAGLAGYATAFPASARASFGSA